MLLHTIPKSVLYLGILVCFEDIFPIFQQKTTCKQIMCTMSFIGALSTVAVNGGRSPLPLERQTFETQDRTVVACTLGEKKFLVEFRLAMRTVY